MQSDRPRHRAAGAAGGAGGNSGSVGRTTLVWLAVIGAISAVAGPVLLSPYAIKSVGEGSVGVLRFGGKVLDEIKAPGYHFVLPFLYELIEVPVNVRTTEVRQVPCGTSGGVLVYFPLVEIIHRLHPASVVSTLKAYEDYEQAWIIDRVRHDVKLLCARHSLHEVHIDKFDQLDDMLETASAWVPGLMIVAARVAKPTIPSQLHGDFVRVEEEISKLKVAHQHEQLVVRNAEMERSRQVMAAENDRDIARMTMDRQVEETEADLRIHRIQDEMHLTRSKDHADAASYSKLREAEGNERRLSPAFLEQARQKALYQNLEAYYGNRMPEYVKVNSNSNRLDGGEGGSVGSEAARGAAAFWGRGGHG
ncbi:unnamed protein product [Ectocarpus sp. CCAP 1310/34]|nr:unnamed protein product [Ectocarpus sp. CCAP 1310/34]